MATTNQAKKGAPASPQGKPRAHSTTKARKASRASSSNKAPKASQAKAINPTAVKKTAAKKSPSKKAAKTATTKRASRKVKVKLIVQPHGEGLELPAYETAQSAGMDIRAAVTKKVVLKPHQRELIPTGLSIALPAGYEAQIRPRSGLALKHGLTCLNTPGTIDADYRGEVKVILINLGAEPFTIKRGERIAQMVIAPVTQATWDVVDELPQTARGAGGFGSTGR